MGKQKIKKGGPRFSEVFAGMPTVQKVLMIAPLVFLLVLLVYLAFFPKVGGSSPQANRELLLVTDGKWAKFEEYGISIWVPKDLPEETLEGETASYTKRFVQRDKGHFPELAFGIVVAPEVNGRTFDLENDPTGVLDVTTPLLTAAFGEMMNGAYPTLSTDLETITLASGETALEGRGEATVTLVYQDPKDATNQWSEETPTNLYYNVTIFHGRPVIVWGTWDYSTYEGENRTVDAVTDGVISVMRTEGSDVKEPHPDDYDTTQPVTYSAQYPETKSGGTSTWDETRQVWVNDETGEIDTELPPLGDPYWDDKEAEPFDADTQIGGSHVVGSSDYVVPDPPPLPDEELAENN